MGRCREKLGLGIIARNNTETALQAWWSVAREEVTNPVVVETNTIHVAFLVAQQNG